MILCEVDDDRHKHWESFLFVSLQNVQKVIILEEAHSSVSNLEVDTTNAFDNSLEQSWDEGVNLIDLTDFKDLLKLSQEKSLLDAVSKWPVLEKPLKKRDSQSSILGEEEHGAS